MSGTYQGINTLQFTPDNKYCYWYSGEFTSSSTLKKLGEFTTGSYYLLGEIRIAGMTDMGSPATGSTLAVRVFFSDTVTTSDANATPEQVVVNLKTDGASEDMPFSDTAKLIIPPFTTVKMFRDNDTTSTSVDGTVSFTAKVKGTVEQFDLEL